MERAMKLTRLIDSTGLPMTVLPSHSFDISIWGERAMFTTGDSRGSGNYRSYIIPVAGQLEGLIRSIYWKPAFNPVVDMIRVMNPVDVPAFSGFIHRGSKGGSETEGSPVQTTAPLVNVWYKVRFHLEWDPVYEDREGEMNTRKHLDIMSRCLDKPRKKPYLGQSQYEARIRSTNFFAEEGAYDGTGCINFTSMPLRRLYPDICGNREQRQSFWTPVMENGILKPPSIEDTPIEDTIFLCHRDLEISPERPDKSKKKGGQRR